MAIIKKATTKKKKNNFFIFSGIFICLKTQYFIQATKTNDNFTKLPIRLVIGFVFYLDLLVY